MANWIHRCDIKQHLDNDDIDTRAKVLNISREIASCSGFRGTDFVERFEDMLEIDVYDVEEIDSYLAEIYDYADERRIWTSG